jgi:hypothetical protein
MRYFPTVSDDVKLTIRKFLFNSVNVNSGEVLKSNKANAVCKIVMSFLEWSFCFYEKGNMKREPCPHQ